MPTEVIRSNEHHWQWLRKHIVMRITDIMCENNYRIKGTLSNSQQTNSFGQDKHIESAKAPLPCPTQTLCCPHVDYNGRVGVFMGGCTDSPLTNKLIAVIKCIEIRPNLMGSIPEI